MRTPRISGGILLLSLVLLNHTIMYSANTTIKYKRIITDFGLLINQILI
nr:MAG TPA: hypothetical protein [Caudoviricetes sp.]